MCFYKTVYGHQGIRGFPIFEYPVPKITEKHSLSPLLYTAFLGEGHPPLTNPVSGMTSDLQAAMYTSADLKSGTFLWVWLQLVQQIYSYLYDYEYE